MTEAPQVEQLFKENGRLYQVSPSRYLFPADQVEIDRLDIFAQLFKLVRKTKLHSECVKIEKSSRVLDLGCGSGLWVIEVALISPQLCLFIGVDVQMTQPPTIPSTVRFTEADIEAPWPEEMSQHAPYDLINCRLMKGAIQSWPALYEKVAAHLKPETGVFEQFDIDWQFRCDDGPIPEALKQWSDEVHKAETHGMSLLCKDTRDTLLENGFCNVQEQTFRLPINDWKDDNHYKNIGRWFNTALTHSIFPMALAPLRRISNKTLHDINELETSVKKALSSEAQTNGVYCLLYIWTARTGMSENKSRNKNTACLKN